MVGTRSRRGVTSIEYAMIAVLVSIVVIVGVSAIGQDLDDIFQTLVQAFGGS